MKDVGIESTDLLTIEQAAEIAGMPVHTFQLYVSSGEIRAERVDGKVAMFHRESARRIGEMQRETVAALRHQAIEQLTAELVVLRQGLGRLSEDVDARSDQLSPLRSDIENHDRSLSAQQEAIHALTSIIDSHSSRLESVKGSIDAVQKQSDGDRSVIERQQRSIEALQQVIEEQKNAIHNQSAALSELTQELQETRARMEGLQEQLVRGLVNGNKLISRSWLSSLTPNKSEDEIAKALIALREAVDQIHQSKDGTATVTDTLKKQTLDQHRMIEVLKKEQTEANRQLDKLSHLINEIQTAQAVIMVEEPEVEPDPEPEDEEVVEVVDETVVDVEEAEVDEVVEDEIEETANPKPVEQENPLPPPAKAGVLREIEFNYLMERMGYRRLDSYTPEELVDTKVQIPDDDSIRAFLAKYELGCDASEASIASVTRGEWNMIQYQRVAKKASRRNWMAGKR